MIMFVECQQEPAILRWIIVAELIQPLDRFFKNRLVKSVCIRGFRRMVFSKANVKRLTADFLNPVQDTVGGCAKLSILGHIGDGVQCGPLFLPYRRVLRGTINLEPQQTTLLLIEPSSESADLLQRNDVSSQTEDGAFLELGIRFGDEWADVTKFIQINNVVQSPPQNTKARAMEHGPRKEGKTNALRFTANMLSRATFVNP